MKKDTMDLPLALHTAARRFCADQHYRWSLEYSQLTESGEDRVGMGYTPTAYRLFPRYRLDEAIQMEVEKTVREKLTALEEARVMILDAGRRAFTSLVQEFKGHSDALIALDDEWRAFGQYISDLGPEQLQLIKPLPSRRVLTEPESKQLRQTLADRWRVNGYWYPLSQPDSQMNVIAFHEELWEQRGGTEILLRALEDRTIDKCLALLEGPSDYEIDRALVDPTYRGDEIFITSDFEWLIYSSHESSIAVAGWLADIFKSQWQDWPQITYEGPFHTADLRGTRSTF
jgi:hypothetical protein